LNQTQFKMIRTTTSIVKLSNAPELCRLVPSGAVVLRCTVPCMCYPTIRTSAGWSYQLKNEIIPPSSQKKQLKNEVHAL
jgi:hypothetical protein